MLYWKGLFIPNVHMDQAPMGEVCKCPHHKMVPFFIVLIGVVFLLKALGVLSQGTADLLWPVILMAIGFQKLARGACKCYSKH